MVYDMYILCLIDMCMLGIVLSFFHIYFLGKSNLKRNEKRPAAKAPQEKRPGSRSGQLSLLPASQLHTLRLFLGLGPRSLGV